MASTDNQQPLSASGIQSDLKTKRQLWFAAMKPPMYTVAITPICVGSFAAYYDATSLHVPTLLTFLGAAVAIILWINLTNDAFDFNTGIDKKKQESVVNLCGGDIRARNIVLVVAFSSLLVGFLALTSLCRATATQPKDFTVIAVIGIAVTGGYLYQGPPFRLGYFGLGEPITLITWTISVAAAYYSQIRVKSSASLSTSTSSNVRKLLGSWLWAQDRSLCAAAFLVSIPTMIILFSSHFHQEDEDREAGKMSSIVRLGTFHASRVLIILLSIFAGLHIFFLQQKMLPAIAFTAVLPTLQSFVSLGMFVLKNHDNPPVIRISKYFATKMHFIHGMLLTVGFLVASLSKNKLS